ncbi:MAG: TolB family protein [Spirochaetia bacterium]
MTAIPFPRITARNPRSDVRYLTPDLPGSWHRFFDTSPVSPSGRYLAVTSFPFEDRSPYHGEPAEAAVIDLEQGKTVMRTSTRGWDTQLGAQCQWGTTDHELYYNDMDPDDWKPYGIKTDPLSGAMEKLEGTVYMVSPDGGFALSPDLRRMGFTQSGYGVRVPPSRIPLLPGAPETDGIWITRTRTGKTELLLPLSEIAAALGREIEPCSPDSGDFYCFHLKWNPQQTRIMAVIRFRPWGTGGARIFLVTLKPDGSDLRMSLPPSVWGPLRGHHPQWHPDGEHIIMNLALEGNGNGLRFVQFRYDGRERKVLVPGATGSGHPSIHPGGKYLLTDWYEYESPYSDGTTAVRWINLRDGTETELARIPASPGFTGPLMERRVDPHPVFTPDGGKAVFNGCYQGVRGVFSVELSL